VQFAPTLHKSLQILRFSSGGVIIAADDPQARHAPVMAKMDRLDAGGVVSAWPAQRAACMPLAAALRSE
jgi:hypothetical protein